MSKTWNKKFSQVSLQRSCKKCRFACQLARGLPSTRQRRGQSAQHFFIVYSARISHFIIAQTISVRVEKHFFLRGTLLCEEKNVASGHGRREKLKFTTKHFVRCVVALWRECMRRFFFPSACNPAASTFGGVLVLMFCWLWGKAVHQHNVSWRACVIIPTGHLITPQKGDKKFEQKVE